MYVNIFHKVNSISISIYLEHQRLKKNMVPQTLTIRFANHRGRKMSVTGPRVNFGRGAIGQFSLGRQFRMS